MDNDNKFETVSGKEDETSFPVEEATKTSEPAKKQEQPPQPEGGVHHHYHYPPYQPYPQYQQGQPQTPLKQKSSKPGVAGGLLLIVAVLGIASAIAFGFMGTFIMEGMEGSFWENSTGSMYGIVTDDKGVPLDNVTVSIVGQSGITDITNSEGRYTLYGVPLGEVEITAEKTGYKTLNYKRYLVPDDTKITVGSEKWNTTDGSRQDLELPDGTGTVSIDKTPPIEAITSFFWVCVPIMIGVSVITLLGAVFALKRTNWPIAVIGAVCGIFSVGAVFALIALFILVISHEEFEGGIKFFNK